MSFEQILEGDRGPVMWLTGEREIQTLVVANTKILRQE